MNYATKEDLALWLGYENELGEPDLSSLPPGVERLIRNASMIIDAATLKMIDQSNEQHLDIAMNATTAQCEYWIDGVGEAADINPEVKGYSAGKFSVDFGSGAMVKLAPRARRALWLGGLLKRTVNRT